MSEIKEELSANALLIYKWLDVVFDADLDAVKTDKSIMDSVNYLARMMDKGFLSIDKSNQFIHKLKFPLGETSELTYLNYYTGADQEKIKRDSDKYGEIGAANMFTARLTGLLGGEVKKLKNTDLKISQNIQCLYFLA